MAKRKVKAAKPAGRLRLLMTCVGRRVELMRCFRDAAGKLKLKLQIHGADANRLTPAMQLVDRAHVVPGISSGQYVDSLAQLIKRYKIDLLVPLLDSELAAIAQARQWFAQLGCTAIISSPDVITKCQDKLATYRAFQEAGIDTPQTWPWLVLAEQKKLKFPYYLKPRRGSAAKGNFIVNNLDELRILGKRVPEAIVQEYVRGDEYTLDVYTGLDGIPRCVVPRKRLEVRSGEVSKGLVVKDAGIMAVGERVARALGDCHGVITVQCIKTPDQRIRVIEVNPRFGGGVPLSIRAGADFPKWLLQEHLGKKPRISAASVRDGMAMLRFDDSVFVKNAAKL